MRAFYAAEWQELPVQPRWATLITGPSGSGKTAVAALAAEAVGASLCRVSSPNWKPVGSNSRGTRETISVIAEHVARNDKTILCIDEICKLLITNDSGWQGYIRGECFEILDGRWPTGMKDNDGDDMTATDLDALTTKLRDTVFVLGIGTFQDWHDGAGSRRSMGFGAEIAPENDELTADIIAEKLPRELANRFNSTLIRLPELNPADYHRIAREVESQLPLRMQEAFRAEVARRIPGAIASKKGVRFLEEAMMAVLVNLPPEPAPAIAEIVKFGFSTNDLEPCTF
jgi:hypothetical protein